MPGMDMGMMPPGGAMPGMDMGNAPGLVVVQCPEWIWA